MDRTTKILIGVGSALAIVGVGAVVWRYSRPLGDYRPGQMPIPKALSSTSKDGMTTTLYRSEMPIEERIGLIQRRVWKSVNDPKMRELALAITNNCPERDGLCESRAVYAAIKDRVRYTGDVAPVIQDNGQKDGVDYYQSAVRTWQIKGGDCDDHSALAATLLALNGIEPRFRVTSADNSDDWSHIYVIAGLPKNNPARWVAVDSTLPGFRFGEEAPYGRRIDFDA